jgi:1-deoxy-D-xylulose-5-phosphate reductoisomerase
MSSRRKRVVVLGSTGSVGTQTLDVLERLPGEFTLVGLAAGHWSDAFAMQVTEWRPPFVAAAESMPLPATFSDDLTAWSGPDAMVQLVEAAGADIVVVATPGLVALSAGLAALRQGKLVAIANKEILVTAGAFVMEAARSHGGTVVPVDSEHNAIWQCLRGEDPSAVVQVILTSSGGAVRDLPLDRLADVTPDQALQHPTWSMGPKITIDSATLMNKGLEIIEAALLFDVQPAIVSVVLHRQSIVHAMVEYADGSFKAQLAVPDMRIPILNALTYPERANAELPRLNVAQLGSLTFEPIDEVRYPAVPLARQAAAAGGTYPAVLNAANEVAVARFLAGDVPFTDIIPLVACTLDRHNESGVGFDEILAADAWARAYSGNLSPGQPAVDLPTGGRRGS